MGEREANLFRDSLRALVVLATMPADLVIPRGQGVRDRCGDDDGRKAAATVGRVGVDADLAASVNGAVGQTPAHRLAAVEKREAEAAAQEGPSRAPVAGRPALDVMALVERIDRDFAISIVYLESSERERASGAHTPFGREIGSCRRAWFLPEVWLDYLRHG